MRPCNSYNEFQYWLKSNGTFSSPTLQRAFPTRFGIILIAPGYQWEPIYKVKENNGKVIDFAWFCPHCGREFKSKKSCRLHCLGKIGMHIATCPALHIHQCNSDCPCGKYHGKLSNT